jgi:hypothetical protein
MIQAESVTGDSVLTIDTIPAIHLFATTTDDRPHPNAPFSRPSCVVPV